MLIDLWSVFGSKSIKNRSKTYRKQDASWDGFWMVLGSIVGGFWAQVGGQVGAKLAPKSKEMGYQDDVKKIIKNLEPQWSARVRKGTQWYAVVVAPGP